MSLLQTRKILRDVECREIVRKKLKRESLDNWKLISHDVVPVPSVNGFMGQYFNLTATIMEEHSQNSRLLKFFVKLPPPSGSPQDKFNQEMGNCKKEFDLYNLVFPKILSSEYLCVPGCYSTLQDTAIVLDDMSHQGFKMTSKYEPFDYEHCAVLMKTLGKFHAASMIFEELENKNLHDEFSKCLGETLWPLDKIRSMLMFDAALKGVISLVDLLPDLSNDEKSAFKEKIRVLSIAHPGNLLPSKTFRNVLCHGDLWANNLLFKYDAHGCPSDSCLIDFQLARYSPPAHEILCFLQFTTTRDLRARRLDELLHVYHESLTSCLVKSGLDAVSIFPWEELVSSVRDMRLSCMMHGILNIPMQLIDEDATNKYFVNGSENVSEDFHLDRTPLFCEQFNQVQAYNFRMKDSLLELYEHSENIKLFSIVSEN